MTISITDTSSRKIVFAVSSLSFILLGWGLMFGGNNPILGTQNLCVLGPRILRQHPDLGAALLG